MCHKSKGNRRIEVNKNLNRPKAKARANLMSERGLYHRSKRPVAVEAVFGQLKSNNRFTRFTLRGLVGAGIEFGLMSIGHNLRKLMAKLLGGILNRTNKLQNKKNRAIVVNTNR